MTLPKLSRTHLLSQKETPLLGIETLPEKILQFGTGRFLRGFFDHFIHLANVQGVFNGRIVTVQSTGNGRTEMLNMQNGLYTLYQQGLQQNDKAVEAFTICTAISRALFAESDWEEVLALTKKTQLEIIVSNTTEVGIVYQPEKYIGEAPSTFPGKLTAVLYHRFFAFNGETAAGLVILPCELIENNGDVLKKIVLKIAEDWDLGAEFKYWVENANHFCNTLVDRIVSGAPDAEKQDELQKQLGYRDQLLTYAEFYSLFAIEGNKKLHEKLAFCAANPSIIVTKDIGDYRERKLRLLNATHTIAVPLAYLSGLNDVINMMEGVELSTFVETLMREEIAPCLDMDQQIVSDYIDEVLSRFRNPFLKHALLDITFQISKKQRVRVLPLVARYQQKFGKSPARICKGFAAYLQFMKGVIIKDGKIHGKRQIAEDEQFYPIWDDEAGYFYRKWQTYDKSGSQDAAGFVETIFEHHTFQSAGLPDADDFFHTVGAYLE